jgi:cyclophilin family peptidyl-prolyl cis-trans isomerase
VKNIFLFVSSLLVCAAAFSAEPKPAGAMARVQFATTTGIVELELDRSRAPKTVENFLTYVKDGHYDGTIFHRVIKGFMIQGGGFTKSFTQKPTRAPIANEADNGLKNLTGTVAMARTSDPHSASAQFFINTVDNPNLDHTGKNATGWGYCVFGKVTKGLDVVKKIEAEATGSQSGHRDVPLKTVVIERAQVLK